jgi:hypothetical protein
MFSCRLVAATLLASGGLLMAGVAHSDTVEDLHNKTRAGVCKPSDRPYETLWSNKECGTLPSGCYAGKCFDDYNACVTRVNHNNEIISAWNRFVYKCHDLLRRNRP